LSLPASTPAAAVAVAAAAASSPCEHSSPTIMDFQHEPRPLSVV
jgi:hypothetical protein